MVIEDEYAIRRILEHALKKAGFEVVAVENGRLGVEKMREGAFDMLLLDLMLPQMDGFEVLRVMGEEGISIPKILIITNLSEDEVMGRLTGKVVSGVFIKADYDLMEIVDFIIEQLGGKKRSGKRLGHNAR